MRNHKHVNFFAPIFICLAFGFAIIAVVPLVFPGISIIPRTMTFDDCMKVKNSVELDMYPPVCITKDGKRYTKNLPAVQMPTSVTSGQTTN